MVKVMGDVKVESHNVSVTSHRLTSLSFHVNQPSHSWDTAFSNFDLENQGSMSWVRSQFKSQWGSNILSTHIPFVPCQWGIPFLSYDFLKIWPWKSRVKVIGEVTVQSHNEGITSCRLTSLSFYVNRPSHSWDTAISKFDLEIQGSRSWVRSQFKSQWGSNILSTHIPFVPCQWGIPFLSYDFLKIWPWKSRVKVIGEVTVQSHSVDLASYRLTSLSFNVNRPSHSWDTAFSKFDLENQGSRSWLRSQLKSQWGSYILSTHMPFVPCQSALPFLRYNIFKIWPWKSRAKVKWLWFCTTTGLDNSIENRMV